MKSKRFRNNIFYRFSTLLVFAALVIVAVLQYRWVVSSGEKSIIELEQSISFSVYGAIAQEFSNFNVLHTKPVMNDDKIDDEQVKKIIEGIFIDYTAYFDSDYINSFSYFFSSSREKMYTYENGLWNTTGTIPDIIFTMDKQFRIPVFRYLSLIFDKEDRNRVWLLKSLQLQEEVFIVISFNMQDFFAGTILPNIQSVLNDYELKYQFTDPENNYIFKNENYTFSPFRTIFNNLFRRNSLKSIYLPYYLTPFDRIKKDDPVLTHDKPYIYLNILSENKSLIRKKESYLAQQWLISLLLLLGVGAAYTLILYQIYKLRKLRMREKEFVATVTHELRTPLTVIHAAADNIKSGILSPEKIKKYGHLITDQSTRLSSMIEGILLFSRLEGKVEQAPQLKEVLFADIHRELEIVIESLKKEYDVKFSFDLRSLPESARTNRETVELILTNLITNSCKHGYNGIPGGEVRIRAHVQLPNTLIFTVEDDGNGIEKKEIKHIFEPFFRGNTSFKNQIKGSGLGLYLSFRKARLLGGSLSVSSPYESLDGGIKKGSSFSFQIPYNPVNKDVQK